MAREKRTENFKLALRMLLAAVGDGALDEVRFRPENYRDILATTWEEMHTFDLLEALGPTGEFVFTGRGWTAAVLSTGARRDKAFTERLEKLFALMKGFVKGRKEPGHCANARFGGQDGATRRLDF